MIKRWYEDHYESFWRGFAFVAWVITIFVILTFLQWAFDD